jgi:hypothetical protein
MTIQCVTTTERVTDIAAKPLPRDKFNCWRQRDSLAGPSNLRLRGSVGLPVHTMRSRLYWTRGSYRGKRESSGETTLVEVLGCFELNFLSWFVLVGLISFSVIDTSIVCHCSENNVQGSCCSHTFYN